MSEKIELNFRKKNSVFHKISKEEKEYGVTLSYEIIIQR